MSYEPPEPPFVAKQLVSTAAKVCRLKARLTEAALLESSVPEILYDGYDNFQDGTHFYRLILKVSVEAYADVEDDLTTVEQKLLERVQAMTRDHSGYRITAVVIRPDDALTGAREDDSGPQIWHPNCFRLFLTHVSRTKAATGALRLALAPYQVSAFVAHDDIAPSLEWQREIRRALHSMDAQAALLTEDFCESRYCDQEVGFALGARKMVLPINLGSDPYGFIAKDQAIAGVGRSATQLAGAIFRALLVNSQTQYRLLDVLVYRLEGAVSWETVRHVMGLIELAPAISRNHLTRMEAALSNNPKVADTYGVTMRIQRLCAQHRAAA